MSNYDNDCPTCDHIKGYDRKDGHCYMFKQEPKPCTQHTMRIKIIDQFVVDVARLLSAQAKKDPD